jgi:hypothetical protein
MKLYARGATFALRTLAMKGGFDTDVLQRFVGLLFDANANKRVRYNVVYVYTIGYLA